MMNSNERKERIRRPTKLAIKKDYDLQLKTDEGSSSDFKQKFNLYCDKMEYHIDCLENYLNKQTKKLDFEDKIMVSLAEMKKIKDILRGNLNS